MDLGTYLYYQWRFQYYKFVFFKLKFSESWSKFSNVTKCFYCSCFGFGSLFSGWLLLRFLERKRLERGEVEVGDWEDRRVRSKRREKGVPPGLFNEGNTCFTNCVMQALAACPSFYKWTCEVSARYANDDMTLFPSTNKLLKVLTNVCGNADTYSSGDVMSSLLCHGWVISQEQQDAYEFFQVLIATMEEELARVSKQPADTTLFDVKLNDTLSRSIHSRVSTYLPVLMSNELSPFKGSFASKLSCLTCGQQLPVKFEMFDSLMLSLASISPFNATLQSCLDEWIKPELLHQVECTACQAKCGNKYSSFSKQLALAKLPSCLCIQLQRTTFTSLGSVHKNTMHVQFPLTLDLGAYTYTNMLAKHKFMRSRRSSVACGLTGGSKEFEGVEGCTPPLLPSTLYKLSSVVVHFGGAHGGHFITLRRLLSDESKWLNLSDSQVQLMRKEHVLRSTAYLLFYEKVS